jgi:hypothetical protein
VCSLPAETMEVKYIKIILMVYVTTTRWMDWSRGKVLRFVFGRCLVWISPETPDSLKFSWFCQVPPRKWRNSVSIRSQTPSKSLSVHHSSIRRFMVTETASLNNSQSKVKKHDTFNTSSVPQFMCRVPRLFE